MVENGYSQLLWPVSPPNVESNLIWIHPTYFMGFVCQVQRGWRGYHAIQQLIRRSGAQFRPSWTQTSQKPVDFAWNVIPYSRSAITHYSQSGRERRPRHYFIMTECEHIRPHKCRVSGKEAQRVDIIIKTMAISHPAKGGEESGRTLITSERDSAELHLERLQKTDSNGTSGAQ